MKKKMFRVSRSPVYNHISHQKFSSDRVASLTSFLVSITWYCFSVGFSALGRVPTRGMLSSTLLAALLLSFCCSTASFLQASGNSRGLFHVETSNFNLKRSVQSRLFSSANDNTYGPPCIILAGLPETYLETVDDIFSAALGTLPPVIIVNSDDFTSKITLRKLLENREDRDHALSKKGCTLKSPVIVFAGCDRSSIRYAIRSYKTWDAPSSGKLPKTAFAVVVEAALDKKIENLCKEILNDFQAEQLAKGASS